jgi:hypothetical protein
VNLNAVVGAIVATINPWLLAQYSQSNGYTTADDGTRTPAYLAPVPLAVQRQALSYKDLAQLDGINLGGEACAIYIDADWRAVSRPDVRGGDLITMPDGTLWLAVHVLENWAVTDGWTKLAFVRQSVAVQ